jgi:hypothetical protein
MTSATLLYLSFRGTRHFRETGRDLTHATPRASWKRHV